MKTFSLYEINFIWSTGNTPLERDVVVLSTDEEKAEADFKAYIAKEYPEMHLDKIESVKKKKDHVLIL